MIQILNSARRTGGLASLLLPLMVTGPTAAATTTAPSISGTPSPSAIVGVPYAFVPGAQDADGDTLSFSIENKPAWMWFNRSTGKLAGTPTGAQAGRTFSGIRISVSDGTSTTALPSFWITVRADGSTSDKTSNAAPVLTGTPKTSATVGTNYWFKPAATDANGDPLRFSVTGRPAWLSFSAGNGSLWGSPGTANVGTTSLITVSVSDGKATTRLAPFTITVAQAALRSVTLNWTAPTSNTDGSALTDLAGYSVSYGTTSRAYGTTVDVPGATADSIVIEGLAPGTWYFAIKSRSRMGIESEYSGEVVAVL